MDSNTALWPVHFTTYQLCDFGHLWPQVLLKMNVGARDTAKWSACLPRRRPLGQSSVAANTHEKLKACFRIPSLASPCRLEAPHSHMYLQCFVLFVFFFFHHFDDTNFSGKLLYVSARLHPWTLTVQPLSKSRETHFITETTGLPWK